MCAARQQAVLSQKACWRRSCSPRNSTGFCATPQFSWCSPSSSCSLQFPSKLMCWATQRPTSWSSSRVLQRDEVRDWPLQNKLMFRSFQSLSWLRVTWVIANRVITSCIYWGNFFLQLAIRHFGKKLTNIFAMKNRHSASGLLGGLVEKIIFTAILGSVWSLQTARPFLSILLFFVSFFILDFFVYLIANITPKKFFWKWIDEPAMPFTFNKNWSVHMAKFLVYLVWIGFMVYLNTLIFNSLSIRHWWSVLFSAIFINSFHFPAPITKSPPG